MTTTETSGSGDVARSLELLWGTGERPTRGPKPGLSLDRIVTAAITVADTEGLAAVSMRRLAAELGVGAMSLYRYVPGKAELLDLMLDRVQGEATEGASTPPPGEIDWREAMEKLARGHLAQYRAHPWLLKVNQARTVLGPSAVRGLELALAGLRGMGLNDPETISAIISVQSFVHGIAQMELQTAEAAQQTGLSDEAFWEGQRPFLERAMTSGEYPLMASLSEDAFAEFDHFGFGLRRLVAGFETLVRERAEQRSADSPGPASG
ncbi:TetR/AcrR family transcriptional regulator [Streptomyces sp. MUM 178J]|uniref:TetR/AcrR family transcriptional regulator n=1 Tax=Streptomyces sp. MUM 178J TaxID=2791991 RepID=UPI001F04C087|nr:TetR/AcrR family transcriptional regulator [Streptomyces sp. MUM 178J]WRQ82811.1 TetR/AcrR family transcriptional regulator [Streptomyces sp. MUM 178J]